MKSLDSISYYDHQTLTQNGPPMPKDVSEIAPFLDELKPKSRVLDLGCGIGEDLKILAGASHEAHGIEASAVRAALAKRNNPSLEIVEKNFLFLSLKEEWDGIWACRSLHHYDSEIVQRIIATCFKGLRSGGVLGLVVYEGDGSFEDRAGDISGPSRMIKPYSENAICSMVEQSGFKIKKVGRKPAGLNDPLPSLLILANKI